MRAIVKQVYRAPGARCQICGGSADLTLRPGVPDAPEAPEPLDLCHACAKRFLKMLEDAEQRDG